MNILKKTILWMKHNPLFIQRLPVPVVLGVLLTALGIYQPVVKWGGCGATTPLFGFGYAMAEGVKKAVSEQGLLGALSGGLSAAAAGVSAAVFFSLIAAFLFKPKSRE